LIVGIVGQTHAKAIGLDAIICASILWVGPGHDTRKQAGGGIIGVDPGADRCVELVVSCPFQLHTIESFVVFGVRFPPEGEGHG